MDSIMPILGHVTVSVRDLPVLPTIMVREEEAEVAEEEAEAEVSVRSVILPEDKVSHSDSTLLDSVSLESLHPTCKPARAMGR